MGSEQRGNCPLCDRQSVPLIDSHVIPRWVHKRIRGDGQRGEQIIVTETSSVQCGDQLSEPMLCRDCDQQLGVLDNYAAQLAYRSGTARILNDCTIAERDPISGVSVAVLGGHVDVDQLSRFAASVFWRGHLARCAPRCDVGANHARRLRAYLRNERAFPPSLTLVLQVYVPDAQGKVIEAESSWEPNTQAREGSRLSDFMICGLLFRLESGSERSDLQQLCLRNTARRAAIVTPSNRDAFLARIAGAPARGKGARRLARLD